MPGHSHHFSPLYPAYLGAWYTVAGYSQAVTRLAAVALSLLCLLVIYLATRDLMDDGKALVVTAVAALLMAFVPAWFASAGRRRPAIGSSPPATLRSCGRSSRSFTSAE